MSLEVFNIIINFSVAIPAFVFLTRLRHEWSIFVPFVLFIWFGLINDVLSFSLILQKRGNMFNSNIYVVLEYFLLLWQFSWWQKKPARLYFLLAATGGLVWLLDNFYLNSLYDNNSIFRLYSSLMIALFSLTLFSRLLIFERAPVSRNSVFLICTGFIFYFGCKSILEAFNLLDVGFSPRFYIQLFLILSIINLFANLIYAYAILWIPRKQEFTLPY